MTPDEDFRTQLLELIPHMRAFARSLCGDRELADDLSQDTLERALKAQASFTLGTNLKAWVFMILRNQFYSYKRRSWRTTELDPDVAQQTLVAVTNPTGALELDELRRALSMLPDEQREALILIGAGGFSYDEASQIMGVAAGTIKSRVSRARDRLALIYAEGLIDSDGRDPQQAMASLMLAATRYAASMRSAA
ncbi:MAG TPA: sigma-70 family RNA polymerase sigma factor [Caulobacteraceae bacterium]|nr:sigma-70 family RNA polymerase sigma factor [Caulobacteraceae bacterium]